MPERLPPRWRVPHPPRLAGLGPRPLADLARRAAARRRRTTSATPTCPTRDHPQPRRRGSRALEPRAPTGERHRRLPLARLLPVAAPPRAAAAAGAERVAARRAAVPDARRRRRSRGFFPVPARRRALARRRARSSAPTTTRTARRAPTASTATPLGIAGRRARRRRPHQPRGRLRPVAGALEAWCLRREERRRDVALARVGQHDDDPLAARLRPRARPPSPPTAPRRTRGRRARPRAARTAARSRSPSSSPTGMISSRTSRLSTGGTKPAPMPWILCGPGGRPESTADVAGSTATTWRRRVALLEHLPHAGDRPARPDAGDEHVDAAVERVEDLRRRSCAGGSPGWPGWRTGRAGRRRRGVAIARAASTASFIPPSDSVISTRAP